MKNKWMTKEGAGFVRAVSFDWLAANMAPLTAARRCDR